MRNSNFNLLDFFKQYKKFNYYITLDESFFDFSVSYFNHILLIGSDQTIDNEFIGYTCLKESLRVNYENNYVNIYSICDKILFASILLKALDNYNADFDFKNLYLNKHFIIEEKVKPVHNTLSLKEHIIYDLSNNNSINVQDILFKEHSITNDLYNYCLFNLNDENVNYILNGLKKLHLSSYIIDDYSDVENITSDTLTLNNFESNLKFAHQFKYYVLKNNIIKVIQDYNSFLSMDELLHGSLPLIFYYYLSRNLENFLENFMADEYLDIEEFLEFNGDMQSSYANYFESVKIDDNNMITICGSYDPYFPPVEVVGNWCSKFIKYYIQYDYYFENVFKNFNLKILTDVFNSIYDSYKGNYRKETIKMDNLMM